MALLARLFFRKVLMHVHGGGFRDFYQRSSAMAKWLIHRCIDINDYIIVASPQMRETFLRIGVPEEKVQLLRNAINVPAETVWDRDQGWQRAEKLPGHLVVLFLNRVTTDKGVPDLVKAASIICREFPHVRFRIVGGLSADSKVIKKQIAESGVVEQIALVGFVGEEAKRSEFVGCDIYVLPSHTEDLPYSLMEAMSYGLRCIASSVCGIPSLIEDEIKGLLMPAKDVDALIGALRRLITDKSHRRQLGSEARRTIEAKFNWQSRFKEIADFYNKVLGDR